MTDDDWGDGQRDLSMAVQKAQEMRAARTIQRQRASIVLQRQQSTEEAAARGRVGPARRVYAARDTRPPC
eukprot:6333769-Prymnesium_polylepis.1